MGRTAEHTIDFREFLLNSLHGPAGQGNTQLAQGHPLLIGQDSPGPGITGKASLLGAQQQQMPAFVAPQRRNRAHLHRIQYRRDGANIVPAQKQTEQPEKMLRLPMGLTQNIVHLLQSRQQNLPHLVENLGTPVVPCLIQLVRHFFQPPLQRNIPQKSIHGHYLVPQVPGIQKSLGKPFQRRHGFLAQRIEVFQGFPAVVIPDACQAVGMVGPFPEPVLAADAPDIRIVFHKVTFVRCQK